MISHGRSRISARFCATLLVFATMLSVVLVTPSYAQRRRSQDRDNPTFLRTNEVSDSLNGSNEEYFYSFNAGPGKVTVTFDVKANSTNAGATLDLFDSNSTPILSNVLAQGVDSGSERIVKSVQLGRRQSIIMRITGIRYGDSGGTGTYKVRLSGAVGRNSAPDNDDDGGDSPARSNRFTGELDGTERKRTHSLTVTGAGKVTITFDVKANGTNAGAIFELIDGRSRPILSNVLVQGIDNGSERIQKTVSFNGRQNLTLSVSGIRYGSEGGRGSYSVKIDGPVTSVARD